MGGFTIKRVKISVNRKRYTKNVIKVHNNSLVIHYSKPDGTNGEVKVSLKEPSAKVSKIEYRADMKVLEFQYSEGLLSETLQFKLEFDRRIDSDRTYFALVKKPIKGLHKSKRRKRGGSKKKKKKKKKKTTKKEGVDYKTFYIDPTKPSTCKQQMACKRTRKKGYKPMEVGKVPCKTSIVQFIDL